MTTAKAKLSPACEGSCQSLWGHASGCASSCPEIHRGATIIELQKTVELVFERHNREAEGSNLPDGFAKEEE